MCSFSRDARDFPFMCEHIITHSVRMRGIRAAAIPKIKGKKIHQLKSRLPDCMITYYQTVFWGCYLDDPPLSISETEMIKNFRSI